MIFTVAIDGSGNGSSSGAVYTTSASSSKP